MPGRQRIDPQVRDPSRIELRILEPDADVWVCFGLLVWVLIHEGNHHCPLEIIGSRYTSGKVFSAFFAILLLGSISAKC